MERFSILEKDHYVELVAPLKVYLDITNKCNLKCKFCFHDVRKDNPFSKEQLYHIIDMIVDANILEVAFIGGEPLMYDYFSDLVIYAKSKGLRLSVFTNGTRIKENIKILKKYVGSSISISLHAPNDELQDLISGGRYTYSTIIENLQYLNKHGIIPEIAFTPCKYNVNLLYETIDSVLSKGIEVSDVLVYRLIPGGRAITCWNELGLSYDDQVLLLKQMESLEAKYPNLSIGTGDALPYCMFDKKYWKYILRCDYAITLGWINYKGLFGKCMCRGSDRMTSIWKEDLQTIWQTSDTFTKYRNLEDLVEKCKKCQLLERCGGGCSCSSIDKTSNTDVFLDLSCSIPEQEEKCKCGKNPIIKQDSYIKCIKYDFRLEEVSKIVTKSRYLAIPSFEFAIIRDNYLPSEGYMIWVNTIEKTIIEKCMSGRYVNELIRDVCLEFSFKYDEAKRIVYETIESMCDYGILQNC